MSQRKEEAGLGLASSLVGDVLLPPPVPISLSFPVSLVLIKWSQKPFPKSSRTCHGALRTYLL